MNANRTFFILLFSSILILIGLITLSAKITPLLLSHAVYVCQKTFSNVLFSISHSIPLLLIILSSTVLLTGFIILFVQIIKTRHYLKRNLGKKILIPSRVRPIVDKLNLNGRIDVVKDDDKFSFCHGLLRPRICLSTGLLKTLTPTELKAVLLHENYHFKKHDPLRMVLSKTISSMFFFIPILGDLQKHYALTKEIAADEVVIKNGKRESLMFVLSKLLAGESVKFSGVAALANLDLEKRILYLTGNKREVVFRPSVLNIFISLVVTIFSLVLINTPAYAIGTQSDSIVYSSFICPFGDRCTLSCKSKQEKNYSEHLLYTSVEER